SHAAAPDEGPPGGPPWPPARRAHGPPAPAAAPPAPRAYERALAVVPDYHLALTGLGRARAAQGRLGEAITLTARAAERVPSPALYGTLGDIYDSAGDPSEAKRNWELVRVMERLAAAQGATYG